MQVDLNDKPAHFVELYASIHPDPAAAAKVPILIDGDTQLIESQLVVEYLDAQYSSGTQLVPSDPATAARAKLFVEVFNGAVTGPTFALLRADTPEAVAAGKEKLAAGLKVVDTALRRHGLPSGDFFLGSQFSLADVCTLTFVQRSVVVLPVYRGVDVWAMMEEGGLERLQRWARAVLARTSAQATKPEDDVIAQSLAKFVTPMK